ncbi:MAG: hypothetical protein GKR91_00525 [Pseudomonadales bacterium]|nr:hypothetical protein [Pseudomonadales bacterium]
MQVNPPPSIRPVPVRRKNGDKLDVTNATTNFENKVQDSNSNLKRKRQNIPEKQDKDKKPPSGSIDITA